MAANRDVALNILADIKKYQSELAKVPGLTEKQAAKAALQLQKQLSKGQKEAAKSAKKAAEESARAWSDVGTIIAANLSVDAIKGAARALGGFVDGVVSSVDEINTFGKATGLANETVAGLALAAKSSGKELTQILPTDLSKRMLDAANGLERSARGFRQLGVEVVGSNGKLRSSDTVLREIIDSLSEVEDPTEKSALAMSLLGSTGQELLTAFESSDALDAFVDQAARFGNDVGPEAVRAAGEWQQATAELGLAFEFAGRQFLEGIGGPAVIAGFVRNFTIGFTTVGEFIRSFSAEFMGGLSLQIEAVGALLSGDLVKAAGLAELGLKKAFLPTVFKRASLDAAQVARDMLEMRDAVKDSGAATKDATREIGDFVGATKAAAKETAEFEKAQEKLGSEVIRINAELAKSVDQSARDQLSAGDKITDGLDKRLDKIVEARVRLAELAEQGIDTAEAEAGARLAADEAIARSLRDHEALRADLANKERERLKTLEEEAADRRLRMSEAEREAAEERLANFAQAVDLVGQFGNIALGAFEELARRQSAAAREALADARGAIAEIRDERSSLRDQLLEEEDEIERARIEARLNELDADLNRSKEARKQAKRAALQSFREGRALALSGVGFNTAVAVLRAYAMFGPPPSPVGIASAVAAGAAGATQAALIATEKPPQFHTGLDASALGGLTPGFTRGPDERLATLTTAESVLNGRASDAVGPDAIRDLNQTGGAGLGGPVIELNFERRHVDTMVARTLRGGGSARMAINRITRSRPAGQIAIFTR